MKWWIDADPSGLVWTGLDCDDDLALIAAKALEEAGEMEMAGLSICGGNAQLAHTWPNALKLLQTIGAAWKVFKGAGWQQMQPAWASLRLLGRLMRGEEDSEDAVEALIQTASSMPPQSLNVLMLGPCTNLARALQRAPWLASHLKRAVLMGGELTGRRLDLNFMSDRAAARHVISANLPTVIVPIQTCAQSAVTADFVRRVESCDSAARAVLPKMRLQTWLMPVLVNRRVQVALEGLPRSAALDAGFIPWDVVALLAAVRPHLFTGWDFLEVAFPSCSQEPCNGTMLTQPSEATGSHSNHSNIVSVPKFITNETLILETMLELLCSVSSVEPLPSLDWGFGREVFAALNSLLVICVLGVLLFWMKKKRPTLIWPPWPLDPVCFCMVVGFLD
ncbi:unnamed protein product [Cladocopium goreaui]|uniref:Pyrimidine-specific ribonucleoside hydrolase RihB n=1 Tax=Cladocopium goreaui TaxID=2562237 RepID=A0A9P1GEA7_9DINO|nr:unnamed protein product [Cladocopium goreaui]